MTDRTDRSPITPPATDHPEGRRHRDAAKTRQLLLDAALRRFASDGYAATTVRDIADDAGVNVALISRYFESKEGLFEVCLTTAVDDLRRAAGNVTSLSEVPDAIARQIVGSSPEGHPDPVALLLLRSSGDERAEQIRVGFLRTFGERLALAAGWRPDGPDAGQLMLRAQLVLSISIGIALLRSSPGMEPLASAGEQDLVLPLRDLVNALLSPPKDE